MISTQNQVICKHVMFSYHWDDQPLVSNIYDHLNAKGIPVWMDIKGGMKTNLYESMALAIQEAAVIVCFMTPKYQDYPFCKKELQYGSDLRKPIIPCLLTPDWQQSDWLGFVTAGLIWLDFRDVSEENFEKKVQRMIDFIHILTKNTFKVSQQILPVVPLNSQEQKTIKMILIGRAGSGKSSLGNTILGDRQFDLCVSSHSAITDKCRVGFRYFPSQQANLLLIDTPDFFNDKKDIEKSLEISIGDGICAILLTLSLELGLTNQEEKIIDYLEDRYGDKIFDYIIVGFVGFHKVEGNMQTFINSQCSTSLKAFLQKCENRYVGIDNSSNAEEKNIFVSNLIDLIMKMSFVCSERRIQSPNV